MTREEQIAAAFDDYSDARKLCTFDDFEYADIQVAFEEGAEWADNHPKSPQISIKDDSPYNHKELEDLKKQYIYEKSLLERYGYPSLITFDEWIKIKNIKL